MVAGSPSARPTGAYLSLLGIFAFVWAALAAYSLLDRHFTVSGVTIEKTEIEALLSPPPETDPMAEPVDVEPLVVDVPDGEAPPGSAQPAAGPVAPKGPPLDERPQRILIFGDSMVVNLVPPLADYCLENGHQLFPVIWYASTTIAWAAQSKLADALREFKPTYVIVVLGSSELGVRDVDKRAQSVRRINQMIGNRHFFWLGPPNWREDTGWNDMVEKAVGKGRFFRSAGLEFERESDGIHPTPAASRKWAEHFAEWMATRAAVRIPMNKPTRKATPPSAKVYPPPYEVTETYLRNKRGEH